MNMDECLVLKGKVSNDEVTIIGGLENGKVTLKVIPEKFENTFIMKFKMAYNSPEQFNALHGYSPSGNIHNQPTLDCIEHIFREHMFSRNPMTGERLENSTEKWISLQIPEILKRNNNYDENTIF